MQTGLLPEGLGALSGPILLIVRLGGVFLIAPVFAARTVPTKVRVALLLVFGIALYPIGTGVTTELTLSAVATETLVGLIIGTGAALFIGGGGDGR